jgi:peptidoglycan hydrolase CwlO-like protein
MKTDLASLKKDFKRLTDVDVLKQELNRLASELKKFDVAQAIPVAQRARLEKRYRNLKMVLTDLQKRVDSSFAKVASLLRRSGTVKKASARKTSRKAAPKKAPAKKAAKSKVRKSK